MTPTHSEAMAAARRCAEANQHGAHPEVHDALTMHTYAISTQLRLIPERLRIEAALRISRQIVANTRESMD